MDVWYGLGGLLAVEAVGWISYGLGGDEAEEESGSALLVAVELEVAVEVDVEVALAVT